MTEARLRAELAAMQWEAERAYVYAGQLRAQVIEAGLEPVEQADTAGNPWSEKPKAAISQEMTMVASKGGTVLAIAVLEERNAALTERVRVLEEAGQRVVQTWEGQRRFVADAIENLRLALAAGEGEQ